MLLPPVRFAAVDGLSVYPDQPTLADKAGERGGPSTGSRVDRATYVLERAGSYTLPGVEIAWWNANAQKIETARVDAVTFSVQPNPALARAATTGSAPDNANRSSVDRGRPALLAMACRRRCAAWVLLARAAHHQIRRRLVRRATAALPRVGSALVPSVPCDDARGRFPARY